MSTLKRSRTLESLTGLGDVYRDDKQIAKVRYTIKVKQEIIISRSNSGAQELPGLQDIRGTINVVSGESNLIDGTVLVLQLEDGRRWQFFATSGNPISGGYVVVNVSGQGFLPKQVE